jgi:hypothetical protein
MNFVPNPSNTEFVYLLGLEHVVDYLTKDKKPGPPTQPFRCAQCKIDFTPVWKWEKQGKKGNPTFHTYPGFYVSFLLRHTYVPTHFHHKFVEKLVFFFIA